MCLVTKIFVQHIFILQSQINEADPFPVCLKRFNEWLEKHELGTKHRFSIVADGPFDMARFLYGQCIVCF